MIKKIGLCLLACILFSCVAMAQERHIPTQKTPFGDVQLVSCTTALRVHSPLYLGVRAFPEKGWHLDTPDLTVTTSDDTHAALFEPFEQPYKSMITYPISVVLTDMPIEPLTFNVDGFWHACNDTECVDVPIQLALTLSKDWTLITPECAGISFALANTPVPTYLNKVKGWAVRDSSEKANITLDFERVPKTLMIYDENKQPLTLDITTKNKRATFTLPAPASDKIHLFARTYYHYYDIDLPLLPEGAEIPQPQPGFFQTLQACLLLFLLSAVPIYWARTTPTIRAKFHAQTKLALWLAGAGLVLSIIFFIWELIYGIIDLTILPFSTTTALVVMTLGFLFVPASPLFIPLFLFFTPKPYLAAFKDCSALTHFYLLFGFWILTLLAFVVQLHYEKQIFTELQRKNVSTIWWCARLPWIGLIAYILLYL